MSEENHALISLEARHAEGILGGTKCVELRRRSMHLVEGTTIWLYVKVPVGQVVGFARVRGGFQFAPSTLWRRFGNVSGLTRREFFDYFDGILKGFALELERPSRLSAGFPLREIRLLSKGFQPPQFFQYLSPEGPLVTALLECKPFGQPRPRF